jgi:hypothetical protein
MQDSNTPATTLNRGRLALVALATAALIGGCSGLDTRTTAGPALERASLPTYVRSERYYYSNGRKERVRRVDGERIEWKDDRDIRLTRSRGLIYPDLERKAKSSHTERRIDDIELAAIWPLAGSRSTDFVSDKTRTDKRTGRVKTKRRYWICRVDGTERVEVRMGTFDTWRVTCERIHRKKAQKNRLRTWYYAPEVGHFVLKSYSRKYDPKPYRRIELTGIRPPTKELGVDSKARKREYASFQKALEKTATGETVTWKDRKSGVVVRTTPTATLQTGDGHYCRTYRQEVSPNPGNRVYPGIACRSDDGRWRIPRG